MASVSLCCQSRVQGAINAHPWHWICKQLGFSTMEKRSLMRAVQLVAAMCSRTTFHHRFTSSLKRGSHCSFSNWTAVTRVLSHTKVVSPKLRKISPSLRNQILTRKRFPMTGDHPRSTLSKQGLLFHAGTHALQHAVAWASHSIAA